jgi:uncharacterized protein DUF2800
MDLLRASSLYRDKNCFANRELAKQARAMGQAPPEETEYTKRGDRVHEGKPEGIDEEEAHKYVVAQSYKIFDALADGEAYAVIPERELFLRHDGLIPYFSGHPDRFIVTAKRIAYVDFKPGFECDWEAWESQMDAYAALLFESFWRDGMQDLVGTIVTRFHGNREFKYSKFRCWEIIEEIKKIDENSPDKVTTPGPWCRYCNARLICRDALKFPIQIAEAPEPPAVDSLPSGLMGAEIVSKLKLIIKIAKEKIAWYEEQLGKDPQFLFGKYTIGKGRMMPKIDKPDEAARALIDNQILRGDEILRCCTLSAAQLREVIQERHQLTQKEAIRTLKSTLGELLRYEETKGSMKEVNAKEIED